MDNPRLTRTQIRLPTELYAWLNDAAATAGRSLNAEMVVRLEGSFESSLESVMWQHRSEELAQVTGEINLLVYDIRAAEGQDPARAELLRKRLKRFHRLERDLTAQLKVLQADVPEALVAPPTSGVTRKATVRKKKT